MTDEWVNNIYLTADGSYQATVPCSDADWTTRITGYGAGDHTVQGFDSGLSQADLEEFTTGNKYIITQEWSATDHVAFAGVLQAGEWDDKARTEKVSSVELRGAYMNDRMLYGVPFYHPTNSVMTLTDKSRSGAARAVIEETIAVLGWELPIDLPADGSGGFSVDWKFNERLKIEDHLQQIEDDGCEIYFRPYKTGGDLRFATEVGSPVVELGTETSFNIRGVTPVRNLKVRRDSVKQMTGVLAFGEGGKSAASAWAPVSGSGLIQVRDTWVEFSDVDSIARLQAAADHTYAALELPTQAWSFALQVYPGGPELAAPGHLLGLTVASGHERLSTGTKHMRVNALKGSMGFMVTPGVEYAS